MADLRIQFEQEGFVVIDAQISPEKCERIKQSLGNEFASRRRLSDFWKHNEDIRSIACDPDVFQVLREIYGAHPRPFQTLNFNRGTEQGLHSDAMHFNSAPPGMMCGVWIALEDVTNRNGPLMYCPGSHRMPFYSWEHIGREMPPEPVSRSSVYSQWITEIATKSGLDKKQITLSRGQAVVWAANLLHGGSPILDKESTRWSQVTHYFFEGTTRFVTPLLEQVRLPEWIPCRTRR